VKLYKTSLYLIAILTILLTISTYQLSVYKALVPIVLWSGDTLRLNAIVNREMWKSCKRFRWCSENQKPEYWPPISCTETRWVA